MKMTQYGLVATVSVMALCTATAQTSPDVTTEVLRSVRWRDFVERVHSDALQPVEEAVLADACRRVLGPLAPPPSLPDATDLCISAALERGLPGSSHTSSKQWKAQRASAGRWVGIGVEIAMPTRGEGVTIVQPLPGAPSERAGVRPRDVLIAIDGQDIRALDMDTVTAKLRGEPGSRIELTLRREGGTQPVVIALKREAIRLNTVRRRTVAADVAYLRVTQFQESTLGDFVREVNAWAAEAGKFPAGLVLDLRGNQGGLLNTVVQLGSLFVDSDSAPVVRVTTRERTDAMARRDTEDRFRYASFTLRPELREWMLSVPVVVMVDKRTFSGAEVLAQFLREQAGAKLVGQRTAGLASVRTQFQLAGGESALALVTGELSSPAGVRWAKTGLPPDEEIADIVPPAEYGDSRDTTLPVALAVLRQLKRPARVPEASASAPPSTLTTTPPISVTLPTPLPAIKSATPR